MYIYLQLISYFACKILCKNVISCVKSCSNLHVTYIRGKKHGLGDSSKRCAQCSSNKRVRHELFFRYHVRADICSRNEKYTLTSDLPTPTSLRILIFHSTPSTLPYRTAEFPNYFVRLETPLPPLERIFNGARRFPAREISGWRGEEELAYSTLVGHGPFVARVW